jgi:hypothetical protein
LPKQNFGDGLAYAFCKIVPTWVDISKIIGIIRNRFSLLLLPSDTQSTKPVGISHKPMFYNIKKLLI